MCSKRRCIPFRLAVIGSWILGILCGSILFILLSPPLLSPCGGSVASLLLTGFLPVALGCFLIRRNQFRACVLLLWLVALFYGFCVCYFSFYAGQGGWFFGLFSSAGGLFILLLRLLYPPEGLHNRQASAMVLIGCAALCFLRATVFHFLFT